MQSGVSLELDPDVLEKIKSIIRSSNPRLETGGALFGVPDGTRVLHAAGPGPLAEHGSKFFKRDLSYTQQEAERFYQADRSQWVGEWHTHVDVPATPSDVDLQTYVKHLTDSDLGFERFVALIVSTAGHQPTLAAWVLERRDGKIFLEHADTRPLFANN